MLGRDLCEELLSRAFEPVETDIEELDISRPDSVAQIAAGDLAKDCSWCVNCAAFTAVDRAESEPDAAAAVNTLGPGYLAAACKMKGLRMLHISTDFVFDGRAETPYSEDDATSPLGVYGRTKLEGEESVFHHMQDAIVARTAWLFGPYGESFPRTMIRAFLAGKKLRVVDDQIGTPTYTRDLARVIVDLIKLDAPGGIYHTAGPDPVNRLQFAEMALRNYRDMVLRDTRPIEIEPAKTDDFPTAAARPAYSALSFSKCLEMGVGPMRAPDVALADFSRRLGPNA